MSNQTAMEWRDLEPSENLDDTAVRVSEMYGVPWERVFAFYFLYTLKVQAGPTIFWPWYQEKRRKHESGELPFPPMYPHEIFPQLQQEEYQSFYPEENV